MRLRSKNKSYQVSAAEGRAEAALQPSAIAIGENAAHDGVVPEHPASAPIDPAGAPTPWWQKDWGLCLLFFAATLLVYSRALNGAFVWDDDAYISQNPALRSLHGLWRIWFSPGNASQYYPLSYTGFWVGWHLWGSNTLGYHLVNVFLHATTSVLLWQILKRLQVRGALLAGALFALHPVNVMSVAWMNEMKNTLSASLALGAIWAYLRFEGLGVYAEAQGPKRTWRWYALALALFQLAMFAKTAVSFLPVSLLLIVWWQHERIGWRDIWPLLPMVAIVTAMGSLTIFIEHHTAGATGKEFTLSFPERLIISGHSFFFYLGKLLLPVNLTFVYPRWQINPWDWHEYLYPGATLAVLSGLWLLRRRLGKGLWAAAMHFYISTSFLVLLVVLYRMRYSFVSDHWQYFGSMSIFALMGVCLAKLLDSVGGWENLPARSLSIGLFALLGAMSWHQCGMFKDLETLWKWTLATNPACWMAENNYGNDLLEEGHVDEALLHFHNALQIKPDYVRALDNYGNALMQKRWVDEAIVQYQKALAVDPDDADVLNNLGYAFQLKGRVPEAIGLYQKAIYIKPENALTRNNLANALLQEGRVEEAIDLYQETIERTPDFVPALNNLAYLLATSRNAGLRNGAKAVEFAKRANRLTASADPVLLDTLAAAYAEQGRYEEAVAADWKAIALALARGNTAQADGFKNHLTLYQARQPLRDN